MDTSLHYGADGLAVEFGLCTKTDTLYQLVLRYWSLKKMKDKEKRGKKDEQNKVSERKVQHLNFLFSALLHLWVYTIS